MKRFLVIGNPIAHSLSPKLHNYWLSKYKIKGNYEKKLINDEDLSGLILKVKNEEIDGINITVPFKTKIISYLDYLSEEANITQSVNTVFKKNEKVVGINTDTIGFELSIKKFEKFIKNKIVLILGAGGVVPSLIYVLKKFNPLKILVTNRTSSKLIELKKRFPDIEIINWGETPSADFILNGTSLGLNLNDQINIDYNKIGTNKFYYDVIYNPPKTNFLKQAEIRKNKILNGKMMFLFQAQQAFCLWNNFEPEINDEVIKLLDD